MANAGPYDCISDGCNEAFKTHDQISKNGREMVLDLGSKPEIFVSDETPTPIRLIRNCEEMGLFQDLQNVNPFEETFRKAAEDIRSGSSNLEIPSLSTTSNNDDSLHTPHVVFPPLGEPNRNRSDNINREDLAIIQPDADTLCLSLDPEEPSKIVVQQEADTSQEVQLSDTDVADVEYKSQGTIQFLLRMPNGKMVQLSSLPVEQVESAHTSPKDVPIIKVDSMALKNVKVSAASTDHSSSLHQKSLDNGTISSSESVLVSAGQGSIVSVHHSDIIKENSQKAVIKTLSSSGSSEHSNKMSLAKQRLKQALMNNSRPAASHSTFTNSSLNSNQGSTETTVSTFSKTVTVRRPSSTSDECSNRGSDNSSIEEKRRRNRAAAMRCREKRKTWVKELERRANDMLRTNGQLQYEVSLLRDEVAQLKTLLLAHRDCPVTQALVQGPSSQPAGNSSSAASLTTKSSPSKFPTKEASAQALVIQASSSTSVKPVILLGDPPVKRKRLNPSNKTVAYSGPGVSASSVPQAYVISSVPIVSSKSATVLNSSFVNVIPSVLVTNPSPCGTSNNASAPPLIALSMQTISSLPANQFATTHRQPFILPKANADSSSRDENVHHPSKISRIRSGQILPTNVIKVNPNVVDRDSDSYDSDVEVIDIDINSDFT